jgi:hypothetical protein
MHCRVPLVPLYHPKRSQDIQQFVCPTGLAVLQHELHISTQGMVRKTMLIHVSHLAPPSDCQFDPVV